MTLTRTQAGRRRPRRGSVERPVNGRLYRASFVVTVLPLLLLAFTTTRPGVLGAPALPPSFDGTGARALADELANRYPDRAPGSAGALGAAGWLRDHFRAFGLPVTTDTWTERLPNGPVARLDNVWAVAQGQSRNAIVIVAHRDNSGIGPGANDNASGTAALVELARGYTAADTPDAERVRPAHTLIFLSTDAGTFGGLGAERFASHPPFHVAAVVNLTAIGGKEPPRVVISGDAPRTTAAVLAATTARRIAEQGKPAAGRASVLGQLIDLGFPFTLHEQGPFVARGIPAITVTTGGERPPDAFTDRPAGLDTARITQLGRAAEALVGSLDQGLDLTRGTPSFVWIGDRAVRGWAVEVLLFALLVPFLVGVVDLFAHCRRRGIPLGPAGRSLRRRLAFWLFVGVVFYVFKLFGAWPSGAARPPNPASTSTDDWAVLPLLAAGGLVAIAWLAGRRRLVPHRPAGPEERLAGDTVALLGLGVVTLLVLATNPFALLFCLPAVHAWLWLPQVRRERAVVRWLVFAVGLCGPLLILLSLGIRFGLGFDAPWYLLTLLSLGYVKAMSFAIFLAGAACAAQLAVVAAGRYAAPSRVSGRPERGPVRELVRASVRASRRRRRDRKRRRAADDYVGAR